MHAHTHANKHTCTKGVVAGIREPSLKSTVQIIGISPISFIRPKCIANETKHICYLIQYLAYKT